MSSSTTRSLSLMYCAVYHRASGLVVPADLLGLTSVPSVHVAQALPSGFVDSTSSSDSDCGDEHTVSVASPRRKRHFQDLCLVHFRHEPSSEVRVVPATDVLPFGFTSPHEVFSNWESAKGRHTSDGMIIATASIQTPIVPSGLPPGGSTSGEGMSFTVVGGYHNGTDTLLEERLDTPSKVISASPRLHVNPQHASPSSPLSIEGTSAETSGGTVSSGMLVSPVNVACFALKDNEKGQTDALKIENVVVANHSASSSYVAAILSTPTFKKSAASEGRRRQFGDLTQHDKAAAGGDEVDQFVTSMFFSSCTVRSYRSEQFGLLSSDSASAGGDQYGTSMRLQFASPPMTVTSVSIDSVSAQLQGLIGVASKRDGNRFRSASSTSTLAPVHSRPPTSIMEHGMAWRVMSGITTSTSTQSHHLPATSSLRYLERHVPDEVRAAAALLLPYLVEFINKSGSSSDSSSSRKSPRQLFPKSATHSMDESFFERMHRPSVDDTHQHQRVETITLFNRFYRQVLAPEHQHQFDLFMYHGNQRESGPQTVGNQQRAKLQKSAAMVQVQQMHQRPAIPVPQARVLWKALEHGLHCTVTSEEIRSSARLQFAELFGCYFVKSCRRLFFVPLDTAKAPSSEESNKSPLASQGSSSSPLPQRKRSRKKGGSVDHTSYPQLEEQTFTIVLPPPLAPSAAIYGLDAARRAQLQLEEQRLQQLSERKADQDRQRDLKELDALSRTFATSFRPIAGDSTSADPFSNSNFIGDGAFDDSPLTPRRSNQFLPVGRGMDSPQGLRSSLAIPSQTYGPKYVPQQPSGPATNIATPNDTRERKPRYRIVNTSRREARRTLTDSSAAPLQEASTLCIVTLEDDEKSSEDSCSSELEEGVVRFPLKKHAESPKKLRVPKTNNDKQIIFGAFGNFDSFSPPPPVDPTMGIGSHSPPRSVCTSPNQRPLDDRRLSVSTQGVPSRRSSMASNGSFRSKSPQQLHAEEIIHNLTPRRKRSVQLVVSVEDTAKSSIRADVDVEGGLPLHLSQSPISGSRKGILWQEDDGEVSGRSPLIRSLSSGSSKGGVRKMSPQLSPTTSPLGVFIPVRRVETLLYARAPAVDPQHPTFTSSPSPSFLSPTDPCREQERQGNRGDHGSPLTPAPPQRTAPNKPQSHKPTVGSRMWLANPHSRVVIPLEENYIAQRPDPAAINADIAETATPPPLPPRDYAGHPNSLKAHNIVPQEYVDSASPKQLNDYFYNREEYLRHSVKAQLAARRAKEQEINTVSTLRKIVNGISTTATERVRPAAMEKEAILNERIVPHRTPLPPSTYVSGGGTGRPPLPVGRSKRSVAPEEDNLLEPAANATQTTDKTPVFTLLRPLRMLGLPVMLSRRKPLPPLAVGCSVLFRRKGCMLACEDPDIDVNLGMAGNKASLERIRTYGLSIGLVEGVITAAHYDCRYTIRFGTTTVDATSQVVKGHSVENPHADEEVGVLHNDVYLIDTKIADSFRVRDEVSVSLPTGTIPSLMDKDGICSFVRSQNQPPVKGTVVASLGRVAEPKATESRQHANPPISSFTESVNSDEHPPPDHTTMGSGGDCPSSDDADDDTVMEEKVRRQYNLHTRLDNEERERRRARRLRKVEMSSCCLRNPYESIVDGSERVKANLLSSRGFLQAFSNCRPNIDISTATLATSLTALQDAMRSRFRGVAQPEIVAKLKKDFATEVPSGSWFLVAFQPEGDFGAPLKIFTVHESFITHKRPTIGLDALNDTCKKHTTPIEDIVASISVLDLRERSSDCDNLVTQFNALDGDGRGFALWKDVRAFLTKQSASTVATCFAQTKAEADHLFNKKTHQCYQHLLQNFGNATGTRQISARAQQDEFPLTFAAFVYVCRWMETHASVNIDV